MKKAQITLAVIILLISTNSIYSQNHNHNHNNGQMKHSEMNHKSLKSSKHKNMMQSKKVMMILNNYLKVKTALVNSDYKEAAKSSVALHNSLKTFSYKGFTDKQQIEIKDIITDAKEHAEHIGKSKLDHQREHFKTLSKDIIDLITITGSMHKIYQQYCPMYEGGSTWLSLEKAVKNPYYGSKMLSCGKVVKEIN